MKKIILSVTGFLFLALSVPAFADEDVKITTSYPSPYGIYQELSSTDKTTLATGATATANVGIGTSTPASKLDIAGGNLNVPTTTSSTVGVISQNSVPFIHSYGLTNFFAGRNAGNFGTTPTLGVDGNTAIGVNALSLIAGGIYNTASGMNALSSNTDGSYNTANGADALSSNTTGRYNAANGYEALFSNLTGNNNVANGLGALFSNTTGYENTANGNSALSSNTTGYKNTANGMEALKLNSTGFWNTANGYEALSANTTSGFNTAIGAQALHYTTGERNTGIGTSALINNTTGSYNTAVGFHAGWGITTGSKNTIIGAVEGLLPTLSNNIIIADGDGNRRINVRSDGNVGIGTSMTDPNYNLTIAGNAWVTTGVWAGSDVRWKKDIAPLQNSLDNVMQLNPVSFNWRKDEFPDLHFSDGRQLGLIAQDVEKIIPELVSTDNKGYKGISYEKLTPVLVSAIQEQQKEIEELKKEITELKKKS